MARNYEPGWRLTGWLGVVLIAFGVASMFGGDAAWKRIAIYCSMLALYGVGRLHERMLRG